MSSGPVAGPTHSAGCGHGLLARALELGWSAPTRRSPYRSAMPRSATPSRRAFDELRIVLPFEISDFYSTRCPGWPPAILSCFRQKEISFFRDNIRLDEAFKSGLLLLRPEFPAFPHDWAVRRYPRVPFAPSATRRGYIRSATGAECSWWRPCGRA